MTDETDACTKDCARCDGCGNLADTDDQEPWTAWTSLPVHSAAAVLLGLVRPITCPACKGTRRSGSTRAELFSDVCGEGVICGGFTQS